MDMNEANIAVEDRVFILEGIASPNTILYIKQQMDANIKRFASKITSDWENAINKYLNMSINSNQLHFFASFSYADIFDEKTFDVVSKNEMNAFVKCKSRIISIINEWTLLPMGYVNHGHKSICLIEFPEGIPDLVLNMPVVESFGE